MSLRSAVHEIVDCARIRGFEIIVWTDRYPVMGRIMNYRVEYGASPIRDKRSMDEYLDTLTKAGEDFTVHPIILGGSNYARPV